MNHRDQKGEGALPRRQTSHLPTPPTPSVTEELKPGDTYINEGDDYWTSGIDVGEHGNCIVCYARPEAVAIALRDKVLLAMKSAARSPRRCLECREPLTEHGNGEGASCDNGCEMHFSEADLADQPPQQTGLTDVERRQRVIDALWALRTDHLPSMEEIADAAIAAMQPSAEAETLLQMREIAQELGYPSVLEALEALAAMQQPICADVKRLLREARSYVEQAGLRHHDVSGLLAEIDAALLVSDRGGAEDWKLKCSEALNALDRIYGVTLSNNSPAGKLLAIESIVATSLDTPTINEGEG